MCGFRILWNANAGRTGWSTQLGTRVHEHRGPDEHRILDLGPIVFEFDRLAILDRSSRASQPMQSDSGRFVLAWNGELYNFKELATSHFPKDLVPRLREGHLGDTEVALALIDRFGLSALKLFRGMFAFALWDRRESRLTIGRDRFGIKPLYYSRSRNGLIVSSEIKGILKTGMSTEPNESTISRYLSTGIVDAGSETFFDKIRRVLPGTYLEFHDPTFEPKPTTWYQLGKDRSKFRGSYFDACDALRNIVHESIDVHTRSDVGFAVNVSGGVDSSVLLALAESVSNSPVSAFSVDYPESEYSEREQVEYLIESKRGRTCSFTVMHKSGISTLLEGALESQDEPFGGLPTLAWYAHFSELREAGHRVVLDGSGVDDLLAGYLKHVLAFYRSRPGQISEKELKAISSHWDVDIDFLRKQIVGGDSTSLALDATEPTLRQFMRRASTGFDFGSSHDSFDKQLAESFGNAKLSAALRYKDRASMNFGVELRVPFVDHVVAEFCIGLPHDYLVRNGVGKAIFRDAMRDLIPERTLQARKRSVQSPQRELFASGTLRDRLLESLRNPSQVLNEFVDVKSALDFVVANAGRTLPNSNGLWQWMNLDLWARRSFGAP